MRFECFYQYPSKLSGWMDKEYWKRDRQRDGQTERVRET